MAPGKWMLVPERDLMLMATIATGNRVRIDQASLDTHERRN